jgi:hypothetical protein
MLAWIGSIETYRVHGAAHPESRKARRLAIDLERIALAERSLAAKRARVQVLVAGEPGENNPPSPAPGHDPATRLPQMEWHEGRVYVYGDATGYECLADALEAWEGRSA